MKRDLNFYTLFFVIGVGLILLTLVSVVCYLMATEPVNTFNEIEKVVNNARDSLVYFIAFETVLELLVPTVFCYLGALREVKRLGIEGIF